MLKIKNILLNYENENAGVKTNLYKILTHGKLSGTGKIIILPVDQGFEHGPIRSFLPNPDTHDPHYHFKFAIEAKLSAYAAPLGFLENGANTFAGQIPLILKLNHGTILDKNNNQAFIATVKDALKLGCIGIGLTIYPGSSNFFNTLETAKEIIAEAKSCGLIVVIWSYPRGESITKLGETSFDIVSYAVHIAALIGAHIIKVKLPSNHIEQEDIQNNPNLHKLNIDNLTNRIKYIMTSCFNSKKLVIFSGGSIKSEKTLLKEICSINEGGGSGSMLGRNIFQRKKEDALELINKIFNIYLNKI